MRWARFDRGEVGRGIAARAGEDDADGVEADEEGLYGDSGVDSPVLGVSPAFLNKLSKEYLDPSLRAGRRGGSGSASCPADRGLPELEEDEGIGRSS